MDETVKELSLTLKVLVVLCFLVCILGSRQTGRVNDYYAAATAARDLQAAIQEFNDRTTQKARSFSSTEVGKIFLQQAERAAIDTTRVQYAAMPYTIMNDMMMKDVMRLIGYSIVIGSVPEPSDASDFADRAYKSLIDATAKESQKTLVLVEDISRYSNDSGSTCSLYYVMSDSTNRRHRNGFNFPCKYGGGFTVLTPHDLPDLYKVFYQDVRLQGETLEKAAEWLQAEAVKAETRFANDIDILGMKVDPNALVIVGPLAITGIVLFVTSVLGHIDRQSADTLKNAQANYWLNLARTLSGRVVIVFILLLFPGFTDGLLLVPRLGTGSDQLILGNTVLAACMLITVVTGCVSFWRFGRIQRKLNPANPDSVDPDRSG
jgi:hypothetical protein